MIYIFFSILLLSLNNVLWKKNLQNISIPLLVGYRAFFTSIISFSLFFVNYELSTILSYPIAKVTLGSLFGMIGLFSMLTVIKKAPLQWLGIYTLIGILFTAMYLFFFEKIEVFNSLIGVLLIIFGFTYYLFENKNSEQNISLKEHLLLSTMILSYGLSSIIHWKNLGSNVPPLFIVMNQEILVFSCSVMIPFLMMDIKEIGLNLKGNFVNVLLMALVIFFALLFSLFGLEATNPLISSVLFLANPLMTILFGSIFFREKITLPNAISIGIIAVGSFIVHYQGV